MDGKKQIVLIPFWIQEIMKRNNMPLAECLEFPKVKPVMALNDLVEFSALQEHMDFVLGTKFAGTHLYWVWASSIPNGNADSELMQALNSASTLSKDESFQKELKSRLFDTAAKSSHYKEPFITYDLSPTVVGVVIYPGFFDRENNTALQKPLVEAILKVLYVYEPSHEVAKTPLFKRYLELLSQ